MACEFPGDVSRDGRLARDVGERRLALGEAFLRINAPEPVFTSSTSPSSPAASFLLNIDAQISPEFSTVPVLSRNA